jgi:hypothetical protein
MWWDAAQTIGSFVRWYFVDGAPFLPFPHGFTSENWDPVHWGNPDFGEAWDRLQPYDKGAPPSPAPFGVKYCGPVEWWQEGAPSDAAPLVWSGGIPVCCSTGLVGPYDASFSYAYDRVRVP